MSSLSKCQRTPPASPKTLWHIGAGPKRLMVWGRFDEFIVAEIPAKELRKHVRRKGVVAAGDDYKASVLVQAVEEWIATDGV